MEKRRNKKLKIAKEILKALAISGLIAGAIVFPGVAQLLTWVDRTAPKHRRQARHAFYRLRKRGMIKLEKEKIGIKVTLTSKAKRHVSFYKIKDLIRQNPPKWDGKWWFVMFDIPESRRSVRGLLRRVLHARGFLSIQKSVLVFPYPCEDLIQALRNYYTLQPGELYIFEGRVLEGEETLKKHFKL